jgi:putative MATE family efflux protein
MSTVKLSTSLPQRLAAFYRAPDFYRRLFKLALPIALQNLVMSSLNMVGGVMIGQLGETSVAAVALANQIFFLLNLFLFGVNSGAAMFTAQLWGKHDTPNIRKVLGLAIFMGLTVGLTFLGITELIPETVLGLYTQDAAVIALGSQYLRLFGPACLFVAVTFSYASVLRSIGDIRVPIAVSIGALALNILLSYVLIFGYLGLPALGVSGAALAVLISRSCECAVLVLTTYLRQSPAAANLKEMLSLDFSFVGKVLKPVLPVALNEILWSLGITTYNGIYAHIGTEAIAAMNIASTFDGLALVAFIGIGNACAILIGNQIGAGEEQEAQRSGGRTLTLAAGGAIVVGGLVILGSGPVLSLYKVSPEVIAYARQILTLIASFLWLRMMNLVIFIGILRSGGDTRFGLVLDGFIIWLVGVPLTWVGAFVFHLPIQWVYMLTMSEEATKWGLGLWRYFSKKWIHNLTQTV